jgi:hypothetical protein
VYASSVSIAKNAVESIRDVVQDLLVPELKAVKVSVEAVHTELGYLRSEVKISIDSLRQEMHLRDEIHTQAIRNLSEKLDYAIDIRERLVSLEARSPRQ